MRCIGNSQREHGVREHDPVSHIDMHFIFKQLCICICEYIHMCLYMCEYIQIGVSCKYVRHTGNSRHEHGVRERDHVPNIDMHIILKQTRVSYRYLARTYICVCDYILIYVYHK